MDLGKPVDLIFLDCSKAFDIACYSILLDKMSSTQLDNRVMPWVSNWLKGRAQRIVGNGVTLGWCPVTSGAQRNAK